MKNIIRENAKKYFEEELSGEPLYQDLVIDWLTEFAEQQLKILNIPVVSCSACDIIEIETTIQLLPRKWWQIYKRGWQKHTDFFGKRYFVRYNWIK